jgi:UDP:flavonoid glycosyltransferase YjiC (YdhE family)
MAREEGNRASCLEEALKPPLFLEFISKGVTNIDSNYMPLEHYIGQFNGGKVMLFHHDIVPFCANARENHPRKGLQLVLSIGNVLSPQEVGPIPNNAIVVNNAPQLELLKKASVCITHAGFNTVLEALTQGVPQIAIPVTNDQPGVAARIADKKTGKTTSLDGLDAPNLSALLDEVVNNPIYRDNSRSIQKAIAKNNRLSVAVDLLEQAFGLT